MKFLVASIAALAVAIGVFPQVPVTKPTPEEDSAVVKISTDLIQIDVSVTDKNGKTVPGLTMEDFEVFENGERQTLSSTNFVYRAIGSGTAGESKTDPASPLAGVPGFSKPLKASAVGRTLAIVVDDLNLSFLGVHHARKALRRFVDEQMRPDDLVAIIRTGGGVGALQQFTSDKRVLGAAIDRLRWNPATGTFDPLTLIGQTDADISERFRRESDLVAGGQSKTQTVVLPQDFAAAKPTDASRDADLQEAGAYMQSSLGSVSYVLKGMSALPGRKAMLLFSDGIQIGDTSNKAKASSLFGYLQDVAETANRSSVVVYTFDTKGMRSMSIGASDSTYEIIDGHRAQKENARRIDYRNSQDGLVYLAERTGGKALLNSDNFNGGIQRALDDQAGYYLLAYIPSGETFDPEKRKFNKLDVRVKRPGLNISHRSGFFTGGAEEATSTNAGRSIARALLSPFTENGIALNVSPLYADDKSDGSYVRSFLHIDAKSLKFHDDGSGWKTSTFEIVAAAFGDNGMPIETKDSEYTIKTKGATYDTMLQNGFVYVLPLPLKKPGVYQFRVAVRDTATGMIGSAYQTVEIPSLSKRGLALSSLAVENVSNETWQKINTGKVGNGPGQVRIPSTLLYDTVLRRFSAGSVLRYGCEIYSPAGDKQSSGLFETRAAIYHGDAIVMKGNLNKLDVSNRKDKTHVALSGAITIPDSLQPGDYVLQIVVFDRAANRSATQILPFEIIK
jgi:VWFA-related protein